MMKKNNLDFLVELSDTSRTAHPNEFQHQALDRLKSIIGFDSAVWMEVSREDYLTVHRAMVYEQPESLLDSFLPYKRTGESFPTIFESENRTFIAFNLVSQDTFHRQPAYQEFFQPFGIEDALYSAAGNQNICGVKTLLALFRADPKHHFLESERRMQEAFFPFLMTNWKNNLHSQSPTYPSGGNYMAFCTLQGTILYAEDGFTQQYRYEFGNMPQQLDERILAHSETIKKHGLRNIPYFGDEVCFRTHPIADELICIQTSLRPFRLLSPKQQEVAYLYGVARLSRPQIEQVLGLSASAAKRHLERIRDRIRDRIWESRQEHKETISKGDITQAIESGILDS